MESMVEREYLESVYYQKKVFLTGHTGFKGSWLLSWLASLGAIVKGYSLAPENKTDLYNTIDGDKLCESIIADIRDKEYLKKEILDFQPDFIFHLAAQPLVRLSYQIPLETFEINTLGTANVLDSLRFIEKPCTVIIITTDKVYENREVKYSYVETDRLGGFDPYSASKATAELIIDSYRNSFFSNFNFNVHQKGIASARAGNVIGGGDWAKDRIVPDIVRALQKKDIIEVRNPKSIRPWQHVLEPLFGYLYLGAKMSKTPNKYASAWNFGPVKDDIFSVEQLVQVAIKHWGSGNYQTPKLNDEPHEAVLLSLDINKTMKNLGWKPKLTAEQSIEWTIQWYKNGLQDFYSIKNQIDNYQNLQ
jgi:CDP-glucose 4,6-dehydratase